MFSWVHVSLFPFLCRHISVLLCEGDSLLCIEHNITSNWAPHIKGLFFRFKSFRFLCKDRVSLCSRTSLFLLISRDVRLGSNENVIAEIFDNWHDCRSSEEREGGPFRIGMFHCSVLRSFLRRINLSSNWLPLNRLGETEVNWLLERSMTVRFSSLWNAFSLMLTILQY
jgi:hypothetical protein